MSVSCWETTILLLCSDGWNQHYRFWFRLVGTFKPFASKVHFKIISSLVLYFVSFSWWLQLVIDDVHIYMNQSECYSNQSFELCLRMIIALFGATVLSLNDTKTNPSHSMSQSSPYFCFCFQTITLGLLRSDYFNTNQNKILQVEFNTIASSFAGISSEFRQFHR